MGINGAPVVKWHAVTSSTGKKQRLIVEFAIENAQVVQRRKENEEKARVRSKEVLAARERGELPAKEKKALAKGTLMKKSREGLKNGAKGRPGPLKEKSFIKITPRTQGAKGKVDMEQRSSTHDGKKDTRKPAEASNFKPGFPLGEEGRLARRAQIIQKKRMMRRNRKGGA